MSEILPVPNALLGIDVSHYQGIIDWVQVAESGVKFAYIKATEGATFADPMLKANVDGARAAGLPIGLYHVFRAWVEGTEGFAGFCVGQIDNWQKARAAFPAELPAWLDIEPGALTEQTVNQAVEFLAACLKPTDCIYCSPATAQGLLGDPAFQAHPLAIAHYTDAEEPNTVQWSDWMFWQREQNGTVPGISTPVDIDWFKGPILPI
jgi:lysozyme